MILHSVTFKGLTRFTDEVHVDLDSAPGTLLAVAGPNGAGKSTLLESLIVAVYGTFPTRPGSIYDYCQGRDAFVEWNLTLAGVHWRIRREIDAVRRGYKLLQIWLDGVPQVEDGKTGEFDTIIADHWPSLTQMKATAFAAQGGEGSFLSLKPAARKDLVVRMLGLNRLQELADVAAAEATTAQTAVTVALDRANTARERSSQLSEARDDAAHAQTLADAAAAEHAAARAVSDKAQAAAERARSASAAAAREHRAAIEAVAVADEALKTSTVAVTEAQIAHAVAVRAAGGIDDARAAAADLEPARKERGLAQQALILKTDEQGRRETAERQASQSVQALRRETDTARAERNRLAAVDAERAQVDAESEGAAVEAVAVAEQERTETAATRNRLSQSAEQERAGRLALTTAEGRASLVDQVPCGGRVLLAPPGMVAPHIPPPARRDIECGECPLLVDAVAARDSLDELRDDLEFVSGAEVEASEASKAAIIAESEWSVASGKAKRLRGAAERLKTAERDTARRDELDAVLDGLNGKVSDATIKHTDAQRAAATAGNETRAARAALQIAEGRAHAAEQARDKLAELAELVARLDSLAADVARLAVVVGNARLTYDHCVAAKNIAESRLMADRTKRDDTETKLSAAETAIMGTASEKTATAADAAKAAGRVEALSKLDGEAEEASAALQVAEQAAEDAELLAVALGRNGIQAMELDAAGPAVSSLATEILKVVYGPRFAIALQTLVLKKGAAGKRGETKEAFDVYVLDAERQTSGPAERLSGGEQVVVGEAIKLALSVFSTQSSGVKIRTLIRDESDGALDAERAIHYPAMLRRAAELGGFHRVILVSHRPNNVSACDGVIRVDNGTAVIEAA